MVKTSTHLSYHHVEDLPRPAGAVDHVVLGVAADDPDADTQALDFVDSLGFDTLHVAPALLLRWRLGQGLVLRLKRSPDHSANAA